MLFLGNETFVQTDEENLLNSMEESEKNSIKNKVGKSELVSYLSKKKVDKNTQVHKDPISRKSYCPVSVVT